MEKNEKMTIEEHIETANDFAIATHHLKEIFFRCQEHYPKSDRLIKKLNKILPGAPGGLFIEILNLLDDEYHKIITEKEFMEHGNIYYKLDERYRTIKQEM